ncbi:MAG: lipoyl(octanoyl) transferase LipB [Acidobacteria bacterium]|nr:lipoyl(octanoyl) transferase LipB [Acidobacteriota bacterium]
MDFDAQTCFVTDWGLEPYGRILALQRELVAARKAGRVPDLLLLGEHPPVITLGRNARREHVLLSEDELARRGVELHDTDRGGDVTYHGPGQLVGYPILDLSQHRRDVVWYVRALEEVLIRAARAFGIEATRRTAPAQKRPLYTGVWVGEEKLAAIGVHISRWVTSHGFAFNVTTDLSHFDLIVPCGLRGEGVTSLAKLSYHGSTQRLLPLGPTGRSPWVEQDGAAMMRELKTAVVAAFGEVFGRTMREMHFDSLEGTLAAHPAAAS